MKDLEVLISAMHQKDFSLFYDTGIKSNALMVNQCDKNDCQEKIETFGLLRFFSTKERGLSNSRNMALEKAKSEVVLLCDDDEKLYDGYADAILKAFEDNPNADVICFQLKHPRKKFPKKIIRIGYLSALKISSWQIAFKLESIKNSEIKFDNNFGSGTPVGSGEENIFLYDCLKSNLKIYYVPICIGEVAQVKSNWFKGFNQDYFFNRGKIIKRMMGVWGICYCLYFIVSKYKRYKTETPVYLALKNILKGFFSR